MMFSCDVKTWLESQLSRMNCHIFSTGLSSAPEAVGWSDRQLVLHWPAAGGGSAPLRRCPAHAWQVRPAGQVEFEIAVVQVQFSNAGLRKFGYQAHNCLSKSGVASDTKVLRC